MALSRRAQNIIVQAAFPGKTVSHSQLTNERGANGYPIRVEDGEDVYLVKAIDPDRYSGRETDIQNEITALEAIDSPYVVKLLRHGIATADGRRYYYLVFPFISGNDLSEVISQKRASGEQFTDAEIRAIGVDVATGIRDIWEQSNCVHQDIKPKNIRVRDDGRCVVLDLGIARFRHEPRHTKGKGSYRYSSPEQIESAMGMTRRISHLADQRSLATILYEMAVAYPFEDGATSKVIASQLPHADIRSKNPNVSETLENTILRAISRDACDRFAGNSSEFIEHLKGSTTETKRRDVSFYYQQRHGGTSYGYIREYYADPLVEELLPSGVIFSGAYLPGSEFMDELRPLLNNSILDPETIMLQSESGRNSTRGINRQPYFVRCETPAYFARSGSLETFVQKTIETQMAFDPEFLITPYFYARNIRDGWSDLNQQICDISNQTLRAQRITKPLYVGVALSCEVLRTDADVNAVLNDLLQIDGVRGCYLIFQSPKAESAASLLDVDLLKILRKLIRRIEQKMPVLLAYADIEAIALACDGLSSFATNPHASARHFDEDRLNSNGDAEQGGGNTPKPRYYVPALMNFILRTGSLDEIVKKGLADTVACDCPFCELIGMFRGDADWENNWRAELASKHYIAAIAKEVQSINGMSAAERVQYLNKKINAGLELYASLRGKGIAFDEHSDERFLIALQKAFTT